MVLPHFKIQNDPPSREGLFHIVSSYVLTRLERLAEEERKATEDVEPKVVQDWMG